MKNTIIILCILLLVSCDIFKKELHFKIGLDNTTTLKQAQKESEETLNATNSMIERNVISVTSGKMEVYYLRSIRVISRLQKYTDLLFPILVNDFRINHDSRYSMAALKLDENWKDSILKYEKKDMLIRARLGDRIAESIMIDSIKSFLENDDLSYRDIVRIKLESLLYINTQKSTEAFFEIFESTRYWVAYWDIESKYSILLDAIEVCRFFDPNPLFESHYVYNFSYYSWKPKETLRASKIYFRELEKYFKNRYNIKVDIKIKTLTEGPMNALEYFD